MEGERPSDGLPPDAVALAELLFERLDAATGNWRLELFGTDGRLRSFRRQEEGGRTDLARFDDEGDRHGSIHEPPADS